MSKPGDMSRCSLEIVLFSALSTHGDQPATLFSIATQVATQVVYESHLGASISNGTG